MSKYTIDDIAETRAALVLKLKIEGRRIPYCLQYPPCIFIAKQYEASRILQDWWSEILPDLSQRNCDRITRYALSLQKQNFEKFLLKFTPKHGDI